MKLLRSVEQERNKQNLNKRQSPTNSQTTKTCLTTEMHQKNTPTYMNIPLEKHFVHLFT